MIVADDLTRVFHNLMGIGTESFSSESVFNDDVIVVWYNYRGDTVLCRICYRREYFSNPIPHSVAAKISTIKELDQLIYKHLWSVEGGLRDKLLSGMEVSDEDIGY